MLQISIREYPLGRTDPFPSVQPHFPARDAVEAERAAAGKPDLRSLIFHSTAHQLRLQANPAAGFDEGFSDVFLEAILTIHHQPMAGRDGQTIRQFLIMQDGAPAGGSANDRNALNCAGFPQVVRKSLVISQRKRWPIPGVKPQDNSPASPSLLRKIDVRGHVEFAAVRAILNQAPDALIR